MPSSASRPLFDAFPGLQERVPFIPLAELPTPLQRLSRLSAETSADIWVKRDGLTHPVYGGNKIRKFEFVFGDVLRRRARAVLTGGGLGSHHTLATAVVANSFGIRPVCSYYCQPLTDEVHLNLRRSVPLGIDAHFCGDYAGVAVCFVAQYLRWGIRTRRLPYFIYPGASGTLGVLGYVNAAYEIRVQLDQSGASHPDALFVAAGSCGTLAGLLLGARLAGLRTRIVGVRIIEEGQANRHKVARLANRAARYLRRHSAAVPQVLVRPEDVELLDGYMGSAYAMPTSEAVRAVRRLADCERLPLETTYTGKAMAALLDHAAAHPGSRLLFVDTYSEAAALELGDYRALPEQFWPAFDRGHKVRCWCWRGWRDPGFCWKRQPRNHG